MTRILYRSRTDRWVAGVCGGLGAYFNVDSNAIRAGFVFLAVWQGFGLLLYLILVIILPDEPIQEIATETGVPPRAPEDDDAQRRFRILGMGLVLGGGYLLLRNTPAFQPLFEGQGIGVMLIVGGVLLLLLLRSRQR